MSPVTYLDEASVADVRQTEVPRFSQTRSGYGKKLRTSWMIRLTDGRWRRVYAMCWSNCPSLYVIVGKDTVFLGSFDPLYYHAKKYGPDVR